MKEVVVVEGAEKGWTRLLFTIRSGCILVPRAFLWVLAL